jgi:quinol monooxygenase YgiN
LQAKEGSPSGGFAVQRLLHVVVTASFMMFAAVPAISAQQADGAYYVVGYFDTAAASQEKAAALLRRFAAESRNDAGNLRFEILHRIGSPGQFVILEAWKDKAAAEGHAAADHTKQLRESLQPLLTAPLDARPYIALVAEAPQRDVGRRAVFVVTHVDVIPPKKDDGIAATKGLAEPSRKQKGNLRFEVLQQTSRPNHMTVVELWTDAKAQQAHSESEPVKGYRNALLPMTGALYDERLYRLIGESKAR